MTTRKTPRTNAPAERVVDDAARGADAQPQHSTTLRDQRDRTTGADQATRTDMHAEQPSTLKDTSRPKVPKERKG